MRKHVMRNALLPIVTVIGVDLGALVVGAVLVEAVFAWHGFGTLVVGAARRYDFPVVHTAALAVAVLVLAGSLAADVAYGLLDPRIRRGS